MKYVVYFCCTIKSLISNWPRTRKFSQLLQAGKTVAFDFPYHALRPIFILWLVKIWQVSSCGKFMQHLESCLLWQLKLTEFCVNLWCFKLSFSTGCAKWNSAAIKSLLSWLVCLLGFCLRKTSLVKVGIPISDGIVRFSPCLMGKRVKKSEAILPLIDSFQELHLEW